MRLVDDWRNWYKMWSVRVTALFSIALSAALAFPDDALAVWGMLPPEFQFIGENQKKWVGVAFFALFMASRFLKQKKLNCEKTDDAKNNDAPE